MPDADSAPPTAALHFETDSPGDSYAAVLSAIGQAVVVSDLHGRIVFWSRAAESLYGWPAAQALGLQHSDILNSPAGQAGGDAAAQDPGDTWVGEAQVQRRDGARVPVLVTNAPVLDGEGIVIGSVALAVDLTTTKRAEQTAQELTSIITSTADAVFTKGLDGTIRTWNRGAEEIYGFLAADVVGRHVSLLDPDSTGAQVTAILRIVGTGDTIRGLETLRRRRDGSLVDMSLTVSPIFDEDGQVVAASVIGRDITDRRVLERELARLSTHDALTSLPNRVLLVDRLTQALARTHRHDRPLAVLFVDLDRFRIINADVGYATGDQLLAEAASRLSTTVTASDTVARFSGDAFVIVCEETTPQEAEQVAIAITSTLALPTEVDEAKGPTTATIGIATAAGAHAPLPDVLIHNAQSAMYLAKAEARGTWRTFDQALHTRMSGRLTMANDLRTALADGALEMHFQPIVELASGTLLGVEALMRWQHPDHGPISPSVFVPLAEDIGLITALDDWAFHTACQDIARLRAEGALPETVRLAVNVSARDIGPQLVERVLDQALLPLDLLELEVTETALLADAHAAGNVLQTLRDAGVGVVLDDFGTGYSSLTYLRDLPVTSVKIDRAFVQHVTTRPSDMAITEAVVDLGRAVGVETTAEGIETTDQLALLHRMGCRAGQGWLWSKALPPSELADLVRRHRTGLLRAPASVTPGKKMRQEAAPTTEEHALHRMMQLHHEGASLTTIAAALNAERYRNVYGQRWHSASVAKVIADNAHPVARRHIPTTRTTP